MRLNKSGFTLIELLVVITLIGILALAVLSALNPIEQINKAADSRRRGDSAQLIQALDRYFASNEQFPWNSSSFTSGRVESVDGEFKQKASIAGIGVCGGEAATEDGAGSSGCQENGLLIISQELKAQFTKRPYFKISPTLNDTLYVIKEAGDPSVSVCFVPTAKATREQLGRLKKVDLNATPSITACEEAPSGNDAWTTAETSCFWCIPED